MLTNKLNLPEPLARAAEHEVYSKGQARYSVTELLKPPRMAALQRLYSDMIVEDVADNIWSVLGRIGHGILEASGAPVTGAILEERLYATFDGTTISGAMDHTVLFPDGQLDDYKFTNVYAIQHGLKEDWEQQLNIYMLLRALNGQSVSRLRIVAILRDWLISRARAALQAGTPEKYPQLQVAVLEVPMWTMAQAEAFVRERIAAHLAADAWAIQQTVDRSVVVSPSDEPRCTDAERWRRPYRFALMREGRKTAIKLYDTEAEAQFVATSTPGAYVQARGGEPIRCIDYCSVGRAGLCTQWNAEKEALGNPQFTEVDTSAFD